MKIQPAPSRDYRVTSPYVGPSQGRGRMALVRYLAKKAEMVRASHTSTPPIQRSERGAWERGWIMNVMTPRGAEGSLYLAWCRVRDRWVMAGCPTSPKPWEVLEVAQ